MQEAEQAPTDILESKEALHSQGNEEVIIRDFFGDRREGVFLDVGCFDWKLYSTTLYLQKHLGWSGIAVEASEDSGEGYEANRPQTRFFNDLVGDRTGGTGTLCVGGPLSSRDPERKDRFANASDKELETVEVPWITLDDLLQGQHVAHVDFVSIVLRSPRSASGRRQGFGTCSWQPPVPASETIGR